MDRGNNQHACPLCGRNKHMGKKAKPLYGVLVCKMCYRDFATRRQVAFIIDLFLWSVCLGIFITVLGATEPSGGAIQGSAYLSPEFKYISLFPIFCLSLWVGCLRTVLRLVSAYVSPEFILSFPIFCLKDGFSGSSPGKIMMGLQVVDKTSGQAIRFRVSFKRNLALMIPFMPLIVAFQLHKGNRIGDGWANTRVIWKKYRDKLPFAISNVS